MDGSQSSSSSTPPFLTKTYDMVDDSSTDTVMSWSESGNSFIVWNQVEFERELLPKYFKHNNFSSFVRQLNTYGFRKVDPDLWEFANDDFRRGQRHLVKNIHRHKPTFSHSLHPSQGHGIRSGELSESEKQELEEEIETLKRDKSVLMLELHRHMQQQHKLESQSHDLVEKLHLAVHQRQQMMALLDSVVHNPDIVSSLVQLCGSSKCSSVANKKRRLPKSDASTEKDDIEDNQIADLQFPGIETSDCRFSQSNIEPFYDMESSISFLERLFRCIGLASGEDVDILDDPSLAVSELQALSGSADTILHSGSLRLDLPSSSSSGIRQSATYRESIGIRHLEVMHPQLDSSRGQ